LSKKRPGIRIATTSLSRPMAGSKSMSHTVIIRPPERIIGCRTYYCKTFPVYRQDYYHPKGTLAG
jgi:hypothetical protein